MTGPEEGFFVLSEDFGFAMAVALLEDAEVDGFVSHWRELDGFFLFTTVSADAVVEDCSLRFSSLAETLFSFLLTSVSCIDLLMPA